MNTSSSSMPIPDLLSVKQAQERILVSLPERTLISEKIPLSQAGGRILAEDIVSPIHVPAFNSSAMDGFAFRAASIDLSKDQILRSLTFSIDFMF